MRFKVADIAPAVDKVIGEQLGGLARALGGALPPTRDEKAAAEAAPKPADDEKPVPDEADGSEPGLDSVAADLASDDESATPE
jgi:hypothetical protein